MERIGRQQSVKLSTQGSVDNKSLLSKVMSWKSGILIADLQEEIKQVQEGVAIEVNVEVPVDGDSQEEIERNFLLLSVAYAANIGGTGVITGGTTDQAGIHLYTGSPPNLVVPDILMSQFGDTTGLTFASWMAFAIPVMLVNI